MLALVTTVLLAAAVGVASAQTRSGGTVVVESGETVEGDLTASGGTVLVRGTVDGDLTAFAGNVDVAEGGTVTGSVDAFAGNVRVDGEVGGSVEAVAGNVFVGPNARIGGGLAVTAGTVSLAGTVAGDAELAGGTVVLRESATVGGDLRYSAEEFVDEGATVRGSIERAAGPQIGPAPVVPPWTFDVYGFLVNLLLGAVLLALFPDASAAVAARALDQPLYAGAVGFVVLVAVPLVLLALVLTIVGIPLALLGAVLFGLFAWVASIYGRFAVGTWLVGLTDADNRWLALVVGLLAVGLVEHVPVLGWFIAFLVFLLGLGALTHVTRGAYRTRRT